MELKDGQITSVRVEPVKDGFIVTASRYEKPEDHGDVLYDYDKTRMQNTEVASTTEELRTTVNALVEEMVKGFDGGTDTKTKTLLS